MKCQSEKGKKNVLEHFVDFTAILISVMRALLSMTCRETFVSPKRIKLDLQILRVCSEIENSLQICLECISCIVC